jgi:NAD(P)H-hydrate epimerase
LFAEHESALKKLMSKKPSCPALITQELAASLLPGRADDSHKGSFGKALVIAGSRQFTGAASLAIQAALRSGTGLVYAAIPGSIYIPLAAGIPEAIWYVLPDKKGSIILNEKSHRFIEEKTGHFPALIGPGLGQSAGTRAFLFALLVHLFEQAPNQPLVIDADALNLLNQETNWHDRLPNQVVLTPHEMEFSRLTCIPIEEIHSNRRDLAINYAREWKQTLVLKGANTLVVSPNGDSRILPFANSVLAHGGTGDVLAGLLVGLLAQGLAPFDAATLAVWLHARAAELAREVAGHPAATLPSDIILKIGSAMNIT